MSGAGDRPAQVLTVGHSNHAPEAFLALLTRHGVTALADVRSAPWSRFNPQFNRKALSASLADNDIAYVWLGRELGGRPDDPACYEDGTVRYDLLAQTPLYREGIGRVLRGAAEHRLALMCADDCHRTLLVSRSLEEHWRLAYPRRRSADSATFWRGTRSRKRLARRPAAASAATARESGASCAARRSIVWR